jgi:hypothetical protein
MQIHGVLLCACCSMFQHRQKLVSCAAGTTAEMGQNQLVKHSGFKLSFCVDVCATHRKAARIPQVVVAPLI